jgi:hypothetical protein
MLSHHENVRSIGAKAMTSYSNIVNNHSVSLEELFGQVMFSNVVTYRDRQQLKAALLRETLSEDEQAIINRLLYNVRRGWVKLVE